MRFQVALLLTLPLLLRAQWVVPPDRLPSILIDLEPEMERPRLHCSVDPIKPMLDFGFRFQAGFAVRVPMRQYFGPGHIWGILTKITPEGGAPVYLANITNLPDIPRTNAVLELGGGYVLGEGRYDVDWTLLDDQGRVCRNHWRFDARLKHDERKVKLRVQPGTVTGMSFKRWQASDRKDDVRPIRLTVLLHATPLSPRSLRLHGHDRILLLSSLASLLDGLPVRQCAW